MGGRQKCHEFQGHHQCTIHIHKTSTWYNIQLYKAGHQNWHAFEGHYMVIIDEKKKTEAEIDAWTVSTET